MPRPKPQRKEQIIAAIKAAARKLGHPPTSAELYRLSSIRRSQVALRFHGYRAAVRAAGLEPSQMGMRVETAALLEDWGRIARKLDAVPVRREYAKIGTYSIDCFDDRFSGWSKVPAAFSGAVAAGALAGDWTDVLEHIQHGPIPARGEGQGLAKKREAARLARKNKAREWAAAAEAPPTHAENMSPNILFSQTHEPGIHVANAQLLPPPLHGKKCVTATMLAVLVAELAPSGLQWITAACFPRHPLKDRPLLGAPTRLPAFPYEPVNEMGVMVLFSMLAQQLGFVIESVQAGFPDCEAKIEVEPGRWQHFRIEFEFESRGFKLHGHDPSQCDLIVCWRHNWKNCPPHIQVLELSKVVGRLGIS